jgi:hypothetical protein
MGFTPDVVGGVWVGNNDNKPMSAAAADIAAPIWRTYMNAVTGGTANDPFVKPDGIKTVTLDKTTGRSVAQGTKTQTVDIFPSWYTPMSSIGGKTAQIDQVSGKLATECTPDLAKQTAYSSAITPEITKAENPSQYALWLTALQKAGYSTSGGDLPTDSDNVHHCDDKRPTVQIHGANGGGPYDLNISVTSGTFAANKLEVYFDDQIISTAKIDGDGSYDISCSTACSSPGSHTFKAVVTDAALYQGTDEATVNVSGNGGGATFKGLLPIDNSSVNNGAVLFSWTSDSGASSYSLYVDNILRGNTSGNSRTVNGLGSGNHNWFVRSDTGDATDPLSFKMKP